VGWSPDKTVAAFVPFELAPLIDRANARLWFRAQVIKEADRTPLIVIQVPASGSADTKSYLQSLLSHALPRHVPASVDILHLLASGACVLVYGHMDKQPPLTEQWEEGLGKSCCQTTFVIVVSCKPDLSFSVQVLTSLSSGTAKYVIIDHS